jgi:hypothetical protein
MDYGLYLGMGAHPRQDIFTESSTKQHELGTFFDDEYERRFRYAYNAASALVAGNIVQMPALGGAATTLQSTAAVAVESDVSDRRIYVTAITTAQAADLFKEGWAAFWDASLTAVYTRRVLKNSTLATTGVASYIEIDEPLPVALTTSDKVALMANPYKNIVVAPTTIAGKMLGGVHCAVSANYYCWVQTRGPFGFRIKDATTSVGVVQLIGAATTPGTLVNKSASGAQVVGLSYALWLDEYSGICYLTCE